MFRINQHENITVGLDVGTTKICAVVGGVTNGMPEIRGVSTSPSKGLRKGVVVNMEATIESIRNAVRAAESSTGVSINDVRVGISGGHIKGFDSYGAVGVRGKEVSRIDMERVIDSAKAVYVPLDREVLHVIPTGYSIDGQNGFRYPVGMAGTKLEAKAYIVTGAITSVQNLLKCCEGAGLEVSDIIFEPLASAEAILTDEEKDLGAAIVDIGGGTTDIILYKDGWLRHTSVLAIGGNHFTNDLAVGLRITVSEAERVKKTFGAATASGISDAEEIDIIQDNAGTKISRRTLSEIIQPRAEELLDLIKGELLSCNGYKIASTGIVFTGGGSLLAGFDRLAEEILGLPARIGFIRNIGGSREVLGNPIFATGAGLVLYGSDGYETESNRVFYPEAYTGIFSRMKDWVKGIFI